MTAQPATEVVTLDEQGFPLIPREQLPFVDSDEDRHSGFKWGPVPTNYFDAMRYGRDMALALLRIAPKGNRSRSDDIEAIGAIYLLEDQFASRPRPRGNNATAIYKFWSTLLHFIMKEPTQDNVERFRRMDEMDLRYEEICILRDRMRRLLAKRRRKAQRRGGKAVRPCTAM
jgi:hypothetical protein